MAEYIERDGCREDFANAVRVILRDDTTSERAAEILDAYDSLPAANVRENVRGEWDMNSVAFYRKCPNCKCCVRDNRYEVFLDNGELHYCPNCGTQMEVQDG